MVVAFPSYAFPLFAFGCLLAISSAFLCGGRGCVPYRNSKITVTRHADGRYPRFCRALLNGIPTTTTTTSSATSNTAAFQNQMASTAAEPNLPTTPEGIEEMFENSSDVEIRELYTSWMVESMIDVYNQRNVDDPAVREESEDMVDLDDWYRPSAFGTQDDPLAGAAPGATAPFKQDISDTAMEMVEAASNLGEPIISLAGYDVTPQVYNHTVAYDGTALNEVQRNVLWQRGTEPAFSGETVNGYKWDTKEDGTWVCAVSGIPLFSTEMKYDRCQRRQKYLNNEHYTSMVLERQKYLTIQMPISGTGWPTFASPIDVNHFVSRIEERNIETFKHWRQWEILDKKSGTHLGQMFEDGPRPFGTRYSMNAAALIFVPRGQALPVSQVKRDEET